MELIWAHTRDWEFDNPQPGDVLSEVGIRISGTVEAVAAPEGISGSTDPDVPSAHYVITGFVISARDYQYDMGDGPRHAGTELVLSVGGERLQAQVPGHASTLELGAPIAVRGEVNIIALYEWDAFNLPDTRRTWTVEAVHTVAPWGDYLLLLRPKA